jgi:RNA polymerase sigma-70 factor (ECF subfamily)
LAVLLRHRRGGYVYWGVNAPRAGNFPEQERDERGALDGRVEGSLAVAADARDPAQSFAAHARVHEPALRAVALRLCRSQSDAHDLVQDALERGLRGWARLPAGSNVRAWLLSILRNRFIDACRRSSRERRDENTTEADAIPAPEGPDPEPEWARITPDQLRAAVARLGPEFRVVYQMHALEGRSYIEIADRLHIPKATVGTRLIRARRKLRDLLLSHLPGEEDEQ